MAGCIKVNKDDLNGVDSYTVKVVTEDNAHFFDPKYNNSVIRETSLVNRRVKRFDRIGSNWEAFVSKFTDEGPKIKQRIEILRKLKGDAPNYCYGFNTNE